jgi:alpha-glucosidase (family GH31 glycosyl hydrolase)
MKQRLVWIVTLVVFFVATPLHAEVKRVKFTANNQYLIVEALDDDLIHFELSAAGPGPDTATPLYTSPMVLKTAYPGPSSFSSAGSTIETAGIRVDVDPRNLCASIRDKIANRPLTTVCPADLEKDWKGLNLTKGQVRSVYGLGQQFRKLGSADGDWLEHKVREEQPAGQAQTHGNGFMPFGQAGMVGNVQLPVMYALGDDNLNFALFLDNVYKQRWDFSDDPWRVRMWGDQIRFYVMTGPDLPDLRRDYMELVGTPPVPPRKSFGLWVSEFGYKDWPQIDTLLAGMRKDNFPQDGFVLDLQWFGGVIAGSPDSKMGKLNWDRDGNDGNGFHFPDPDAKIASYKNDHIGLVTIEESYVNQNTDTFGMMKNAGSLLAYQKTDGRCDPGRQEPVILSDWFGKAAMIDWSNPDAGRWIHENRRFPNMAGKGIAGHWTDLGEPETYDPNACYRGVETSSTGPKNQHGDIHNLYAFLWNKSIYDGYSEKNPALNRRPFIVTRSGASGTGRFGAAMWSGDIGSNLDILATHMNAQMQMSFSGIDYYGSDIGGFRREGIPYNGGHSGNLQYQNELYTQWFANGSWFDVPVRPHTDNSFQSSKRYETAPDLVGDLRSNRENIRQRYELIPYYYSLAYRAFLYGEPVVPPLVFYYQNDPNVRTIGHEKLVGKDLLVGVVAKHGEYARNVYLPKGSWVNYHTRDWFRSSGEWINDFPEYIDGVFRLPVFARSGAILPMMPVDEQTKDAFGHSKDGSSHDELVVQVYADAAGSSFTLYEDDGETVSYTPDRRPSYNTRTTVITQQKGRHGVDVVIDKSAGSYPGEVKRRNNIVRLVVEDAQAAVVKLNGKTLAKRISASDFNGKSIGWYNAGHNLILIKSGPIDVGARKTFSIALQSISPVTSANFVCDNGWTAPGENIYAVGNTTALGSWDPAKGVKLSPSLYYEYIYNPPPNHNGPGPNSPKWTGLLSGLPSNATVEWKCVKKTNSGQWQLMPGGNKTINLPRSGFAGTSVGAF